MRHPIRPVSEGIRLLLSGSLCLALAGCLTTPLEDRDWATVRTAHYDILSSLGELETERLAIDLEVFRDSAAYLWDDAIPAAPRTRVYAFDDHGVERRFAVRSQPSYSIESPEGDILVLRGGEGWSGDATIQLKLEHARRLYGMAAAPTLPPWYVEGLSQLVSTLQSRGDRVDLGVLRDDHVHHLREEPWLSLERLLAARDVSGWSTRDREMFEAESWALIHYLKISEERRSHSHGELSRFREQLLSGVPPGDAARVALGKDLQRAVWLHVSAREIESLSVRIRRPRPAEHRSSVSRVEILRELGELSQALGRDDQAQRYFEAAQRSNEPPAGSDAPRPLSR